jgi:hypothetical protein
MALSWDDVRESVNYPLFLKPPKEQFRYRFVTLDEKLENAHLLLDTDTIEIWHKTAPVKTRLYHGGNPLNQEEPSGVFFVSLERRSAEKYGPVSVYEIEDYVQLRVDNIFFDTVAANYGFDIDLSTYDSWEELDNAIDDGKLSDAIRQAEYNAHKILQKAEEDWDEPLIIGSYQDEEFGFFPRAQDYLSPVEEF